MQFIKPDLNIDFLKRKKFAFIFSLMLIFITIVSLVAHKGPRYGIDFSGGTLIQIKFPGAAAIADIKAGLNAAGLQNASVQQFGEKEDHEYLVRTDNISTSDSEFTKALQNGLKSTTGKEAEIRRIEMVGPQVGKDLREKALFAMFYALLFITIYISGRFEFKWMISGVMAAILAAAVFIFSFLIKDSITVLMGIAMIVALLLFWFLDLRYAMGAIVALIHDVIITVGVFSVFGKEFSLPIIAALLTIIGYSLNDTIIVFDRIRENIKKYHKNPLAMIVNKSINETLSRTILTSSTTLVVLIALFVMGGGIIHDFAFAMIVGIVIGTYSSIYIASPILLAWQPRKKGARS
jgi:preprotein translocase subunit SecF